jgi:hypothetical protein
VLGPFYPKRIFRTAYVLAPNNGLGWNKDAKSNAVKFACAAET